MGYKQMLQVSWAELPVVHSLDSPHFTMTKDRYQMTCPGACYHKGCMHPYSCAERGICRTQYERIREFIIGVTDA